MPQIRLIKPIQQALGLVEINQEVVDACAQRIRIRLSKMDLTIYRRKPAQRAMEFAALEEIVGTFRTYYPDQAEKFRITNTWPHAMVMLRGNRAWCEIWLGHDYDDPDEGVDIIEVPVDRHPKSIGFKEKLEDILFSRAPRRKAAEKHELELTNKAPPKREPHPAPVQSPNKAVPKHAAAATPAKKPGYVPPTTKTRP